MVEMDKYYYSDAVYELELNLQNVRRELISMLEVFEETDCSDCFQIKCKCVKTPKSTSKTSNSGKSHSSKNKPSDDVDKEEIPAAEPVQEDESPGPSTPEKETVTKNIEAWIEASSKVPEEEEKTVAINLKEPFLQARKEKKDTQIQSIVSHANAVEAFFKYFKVPPTTTNVTYVSAKLAAACSKSSKKNYSYF